MKMVYIDLKKINTTQTNDICLWSLQSTVLIILSTEIPDKDI